MTLRGAELLRGADVVVYDRLAPSSLLDLAPSSAELVDAGKEPGGVAIDQDGINSLITGRALAGKTVVRLKGGDPFVFGRGGEEALACARAGVAFEIVPGVSSAVAAPAYAGIPLTQRGIAASVAIVTASRGEGFEDKLAQVAAGADTVVVLMAAARLEQTCTALIRAGRAAAEPAALIEWATTSRQRSVISTVGDLAEAADEAGLGAPATLVAGNVVSLAGELAWFAEIGPAVAGQAAGSADGF
jgi:uroporphyrin-III C-methyltransferase